MKKLNLIFTLIIAALLFSCSKDDNSPVLSKVNASKLNALPFANVKLVATHAEKNPLLCTITWTETAFFFSNSEFRTASGPITYTLEMDTVGSNFKSPFTLVSTEKLYADVLLADMITILEDNYDAEKDEEMNMEFRIRAKYGEKDTAYSSNTIRLAMTITVDENVEEPTYPETLYMIGSMNGWDNSNTVFMMFRDDSDYTTGKFTYTGRLAAETYFKFISEDNLGTWNLYYTGTGTDVILGQSEGGAWYNQNEGYYTIKIDLKEMTFSIEEFDITTAAPYAAAFAYPNANHTFNKVVVIGQFSNWADEDQYKLTQSSYDPHIWYSKEMSLSTVQYGIKFRAEGSWDYRWCPKIAADVPYGIADYDPAGHDNNIDVTGYGAGKYMLILNDLTGHYVTKFLGN